MESAIKDKDIGKETPRAYIDYKHDKVPDPGYFKEILQNSLSETEIKYFCEYYIRLLNYGIKQHNEKVICLIGEPNSEKQACLRP